MAFIEFDRISFAYEGGGPLFSDLSLGLESRECTALVGPNGSGKTTLGKLGAGVLKPCGGRVRIGGCDTGSLSLGAIGKRVGYLFQEPERQLFASTVTGELRFALELAGRPPELIREQVEGMLELFELTALREAFPFRLSRGERQRLALAAILLSEPEYLILDEPTTGLDVRRKMRLSRVLDRLGGMGLGMAVISHDRAFLDRHADRVVGLRGGEVVDDTRLSP